MTILTLPVDKERVKAKFAELMTNEKFQIACNPPWRCCKSCYLQSKINTQERQ